MPALIPFLIAERGYSYSAVGALLLFVTVGSSIIQPAFGALSDRLSMAWLMPVGVALAALGVGFAGVAPSFGLTALSVGIGGLGVAAFHPEAARYANYASGSRRGTGMSLFSVGGNAGFALGPILITPAVLAFGLSGTLVVAVLPLLIAVVLAFELPHLKARTAGAARESAARVASADRSEDDVTAFTLLTALVSVRSIIYFGLQSFAADLVHPRVRRERGDREHRAGGDAGRGRARHARRRAPRGPRRAPAGARRLGQLPGPAADRLHARAELCRGRGAARR